MLLPESNLRHLECPSADPVPQGPAHDTLVAMIQSLHGTRSSKGGLKAFRISRDFKGSKGSGLQGFQDFQGLGYKTMPCPSASTFMYVCCPVKLPPHYEYQSNQEAPILVVGPASSLGLTVNASEYQIYRLSSFHEVMNIVCQILVRFETHTCWLGLSSTTHIMEGM